MNNLEKRVEELEERMTHYERSFNLLWNFEAKHTKRVLKLLKNCKEREGKLIEGTEESKRLLEELVDLLKANKNGTVKTSVARAEFDPDELSKKETNVEFSKKSREPK